MVNFFGHTPRVFKKVLYFSIAAHIAVITALGIYMRGSRKVFFTPVYTVSLVEPAPRQRRRARKKPAHHAAIKKKARKNTVVRKKAAKKAVTAKKKTIVIKKKKAAPRPKKHVEEDLTEALSAIRKKVRAEEEKRILAAKIEAIRRRQEAEALMKRLESIKKTLETPAPAAKAPVRKAGPAALTPTGGLRTENLELKHKAYFSLIRDRVQANWIYPERFDNKKVSVIVSIRIGRDGTLLKSWVEKGSGNRQFDESLLKAVRKASPFPALPEDFTEDTLETGLRFCPTCD